MPTRARDPQRGRSGLAAFLTRGPAIAAAVTLAFACGVASGVYAASRHAAPPQHGDGDLDAIRDQLAGSALHPVDISRLDHAAEQAMVEALNDPWAAYSPSLDQAPFVAGLAGRYSGVGVWLLARGDHKLYVAQVQPGSPAQRAGVPVGALVDAIDRHSVAGLTPAAAAALLRGTAGTSVVLTIEARGVRRDIPLVRSPLDDDAVRVDWLTPQVARITVTEFVDGVGGQVHDTVTSLRAHHARGIVIDLRGNPGGVLEEAVHTASVFLPVNAPVVSYVDRGGVAKVLRAYSGGDTTTPLAVLVDGGTASAAEVLAGALQDDGRAVVIGTRTFGKGTVQQPMRFADGTGAELTVARYLTPKGRSLDTVGLEPDIEVPPGSGAHVPEQRATELLDGLLADAGTGGRG